jgi:ABC-2 type transport system ATP-binding protein
MSFVINNISKSYKEVLALSEVSFETKQGELFGLIGPDGAGKTTLFRILATLLLPDSGEASVEGYDIRKNNKKIRELIGYMPGRFSLYHDLSVKENLQFYATVFGTTIEENYDLIKDIYEHIEPFENRLAGKLSGGMKQKLALSCSLIHRPEVLILDEPTTGVDAVSRKEFWDMLKNIQKEGITVLVSTPYMDEAALCDRVALIQRGELLSVSKPSDLSFDETKVLFALRCDTGVYELLQRIRDLQWCKSAFLFGDEIHILVDGKTASKDLETNILEWKIPGLTLEKIAPGIEDYFMELMKPEEHI